MAKRGVYNCVTHTLDGMSYAQSLIHEIKEHGRIDPDLVLDPTTGEVVSRHSEI